jgi:hypothetical protein
MEKCAMKECGKEAVTAVAICTPATGWPIDLHKPLRIIMGLCLCDKHFDELRQEYIVTDQLRDIIRLQARMYGSEIPPDFSRMFFERVKLDSKEYLTFQKTKPQ